jgi:hypothetical protein
VMARHLAHLVAVRDFARRAQRLIVQRNSDV